MECTVIQVQIEDSEKEANFPTEVISAVLHPGGSVTMIVPWCQNCPLKFQPSFFRGVHF